MEPVRLEAGNLDITIRQLSVCDAGPYFDAVDANREHLSQFGDTTAEKYPSQDSVLHSILNPSNPDKLRFGIWQNKQFTGTINATSDIDGRSSEIGYWIDSRYTGRGLATFATSAVCNHLWGSGVRNIYAHVTGGNIASGKVLKRASFFHSETIDDADGMRTEVYNYLYPIY